jgi:hypothetical protein
MSNHDAGFDKLVRLRKLLRKLKIIKKDTSTIGQMYYRYPKLYEKLK